MAGARSTDRAMRRAPAKSITIEAGARTEGFRVVVPSNQKKGQTPVKVNTSFNGNTLFSNSDVTINIK